MSLALHSLDGPAYTPPRPPRPAPLTRAQARRTRDDVWLRWHESGLLDSRGRTRPVSLRAIARISGRPLRTVCDGIARARELRETIDACADALELPV